VAIFGLIPGIFYEFVVKFSLWTCRSFVSDCYYVGVKVDLILVVAFSSPPKQTSFNVLTI
jgi:hypothetical protein